MWEHANPSSASGFVSKVVVREPGGTEHTFWDGQDSTPCGGTLVAMGADEQTSFLVEAVVLHTQTPERAAWEYVDAVQLVGSLCELPPSPPSPPPPPPLCNVRWCPSHQVLRALGCGYASPSICVYNLTWLGIRILVTTPEFRGAL